MSNDIFTEKIYKEYHEKLDLVFEIHRRVKYIDCSLDRLYPIAIVENDTFILFDLDETKKKYIFIKSHPTQMNIPKGVKAAMDLDFYDYKLAAVISSEVLDSIEGYASLFHEFVHCYQFYKCDVKLKKDLKVYDDAMKKKDYMWELNHPFPYNDSVFIKSTLELENYFNNNDYEKIKEYYSYMRDYLEEVDFEYLIWQQWKEGFARFIENKIREELKMGINCQSIEQPFSRVSFYEIGSRYINLLTYKLKQKQDIEKLFYEMLNR